MSHWLGSEGQKEEPGLSRAPQKGLAVGVPGRVVPAGGPCSSRAAGAGPPGGGHGVCFGVGCRAPWEVRAKPGVRAHVSSGLILLCPSWDVGGGAGDTADMPASPSHRGAVGSSSVVTQPQARPGWGGCSCNAAGPDSDGRGQPLSRRGSLPRQGRDVVPEPGPPPPS